MTLFRDRSRPKTTRPPMPRLTFILVTAAVVLVLAFVIITVIVSGRSFF